MLLRQQLAEYISACFTGLWIQSHEHEDALAEIAQLCRDEDWRLATWDVAQGLQVAGQSEEADSTGTDPLAAIRSISTLATPDGTAVLVLSNFHRFMNSAEIVQGERPGHHASIGLAVDCIECAAKVVDRLYVIERANVADGIRRICPRESLAVEIQGRDAKRSLLPPLSPE